MQKFACSAEMYYTNSTSLCRVWSGHGLA